MIMGGKQSQSSHRKVNCHHPTNCRVNCHWRAQSIKKSHVAMGYSLTANVACQELETLLWRKKEDPSSACNKGGGALSLKDKPKIITCSHKDTLTHRGCEAVANGY